MGNQLNKPEKVLIKMHFEKEEKIIQWLNKLLEKDKSIINEPINLTKDTILHFAAYHRKFKIVDFLIENGADKDIKNTFGISPLDLAL